MRYSKSGGGKPPLNLHYNRYGNIGRKKENKHSCVSASPADPVSNIRLCYFLSVKMQNKRSKAPTLNRIPVFS